MNETERVNESMLRIPYILVIAGSAGLAAAGGAVLSVLHVAATDLL
jgi:hypothetical protein